MTCHGMRNGSLPLPKSSSSRTVTQHLPKNQSCALETPLRLRSSARGPSSTLLERHRVAPSDSQARRVSTQSALITQPARNGQDVHAGALSPCHGCVSPFFRRLYFLITSTDNGCVPVARYQNVKRFSSRWFSQ